MLGHAQLSPTTPVIAGSFGTWRIKYTVGPLGIDSGGQIKIAIRLVSDWGSPQFDHPEREGYSTVAIETAGGAKIRASWQPRAYVRPKSKGIVLDIYDGSLDPGDIVTVTMGDKSSGSPGLRSQTYIESQFEFFVLVDPTNSTDPRPVAQRLTLPVVAAETANIACIVPSQAVSNTPFPLFVKGEDIWRNPTLLKGSPQFRWIGDGVAHIDLVTQTATIQGVGSGYFEVEADGYGCESNPIEIHAQDQPKRRYWGDLHAQTAGTVGVGSDDEYFTFGRDVARLDFMSHQGNDFQISDAYWAELNALTARYHDDGKFVVFPGYEWSGSSPTGGDHNVFYRKEGNPILRSSHWLIPQTAANELSPAHPADVFYSKLKTAVPLDDVIVCQHVGGRYANLRKYFDQELISLVELVSVWGVFEWMLWDAFDKGYVVGVMANSDGHHGRPGAEGAGMAEFGIQNGLTCVLASELSRNAIFDALKARRCYGTTGDRLLLDFSIDQQPMGSIVPAKETMHVHASVAGTAALESLELFQRKELIAKVQPAAFNNLTTTNRIRVSWRGSRERGRQRRVTWDGAVRVDGCEIISAETFSFDTIADGITGQSAHEISFKSKTTGDRDGIDILLDDGRSGVVEFASPAGNVTADLADLTNENPRQLFDLGGVDMELVIERYTFDASDRRLTLDQQIKPPVGQQTPYFVKATQVDGQMAWASPIYVGNKSS